jgi:hypothetical protein
MMREINPWGQRNSYIEINGYATLIDSNGKKVFEFLIPCSPGGDFIPLPLTVNWKQADEVQITVDIGYDIKVWSNGIVVATGTGKYRLDQGWRIVYGENGLVLVPKPFKNVVPPTGTGDFAMAVDLAADQKPHETAPTDASLLVRLKGGYGDDGAKIGVKGVGVSLGKSSGNYGEDYKFKLNINVKGKPDKQPEPIILPADLLTMIVYFDDPIKVGKPPGEDQPNLSAAELRRLGDTWIKPLQTRAPELYDVIKSGDCSLTLIGYASKTADRQYDIKISGKRIDSVAAAIRDGFRSEQVAFKPVPRGHDAARQTGVVANEKRVEILIDPQAAQHKIAAKMKK